MAYAPTTPGPQTGPKPYIEGVIVCVNYGDFLAHTLPTNRFIFDKLVVVTDTKDVQTRTLCQYYNVECIQTDVFYQEGAPFNKGKGINEGLKRLSKKGWVLHLDADIYLPPMTRTVLNARHLDPKAIYGVDRLMCHGFARWMEYVNKPTLMHELYYLVQPRPFPLGSRVAHYNQPDGWFPIGFFQLWHPEKSGIHFYPENNKGADHTDVVLAKQFPLGKRHLIPEFFAIHIDSEPGTMGINWNGRKSKFFGLDGK